MADNLRRDSSRAALHAAILTSFAVVQPLFDVIGRAPEFLVAHQATPSAIVVLTLVLAFVVPAVPALVVFGMWRVNPRAGRAEMAVVVALAVALFVMPALRRAGAIDGWVLVAIGLAIGATASFAYARSASLRAFATWLAPGLIVFPLLFLARPGIRSLVLPHDAAAQASSDSTTPVVFVVFDQLGLSTLLAPDGTIDRVTHPAFAALAGDSTWYRNATAVSDYTKWSVPSILTGRVPRASSLPIAAHHPSNLFTLLGASHRAHVFEPITAMCPPEICGRDPEAGTSWLAGISRTLGVAYVRSVAPHDLAARLPAVDQGWNEESGASSLGASIGVRWYEAHRKGRRGEVLDFIEAITPEEGARPALHYLHVLLPHEPFIYFPDGHRYTIETSLPGLISREQWRDDAWAVAQAEQRYLLQVAYVDSLLGQLLDRLKSTGLYDDALIVVTSDHGGSFHPGGFFRKITLETAADILPVPLFIKAPHQREGRVDDRNVESIDIVPTLADMLGVEMGWRADGASALDPASERPSKRAFHDEATREMTLPASLLGELEAAVAQRHARFGPPGENPSFVPRSSPSADLIGADLTTLRVADDGRGRVDVIVYGDLTEVSLADETLPAYVSGTAEAGESGPVTLAVALNGRVRMTTRTYGFRHEDLDDAWTAVIPPDAFVEGRNDLEIFVVDRDAEGIILRRAFTSSDQHLDISAVAAVYAWGVKQEGLYPPERRGETPYRWTRAVARFTVPIRDGRVPRAMRVKLLMTGRDDKPLRIVVNGCRLFEGTVPAGRWEREFDLTPCGSIGAEVQIELRTKEERARNPRDRRRLGVAIERIDLLSD